MKRSQLAQERREAADALFKLMNDGHFSMDLDAVDRLNAVLGRDSTARQTEPCDSLR